MARTMIAMSGGVDSAVAAYLCRQSGDSCMGMTMQLFGKDASGDVEDARNVADRLGMPFRVFDFSDAFRCHVIDRFVAAYERGETPNPCIDCNRYLKFGLIFQQIDALGYDYVATGHYARIEEANGRFLLKKGLDESKDQSYVL